MIIERIVSEYTISADESISAAFKKIEAHREGALFAIDSSGAVEGVITIGDLIRWLSGQTVADLSVPLHQAMNRSFKSVTEGEHREKIDRMLTEVNYIPILDGFHRLTGVIRRRRPQEALRIGDFILDDASSTFIIAEIGINHNGSVSLARDLVKLAVEAGADCVKFQMRDLNALYRSSGSTPGANEDLGSQYVIEILNKFQLSNEQMGEIFDYARELGILALCTPWDVPSLRFLEAYGMPAYKVASADLTNHDLMIELIKTGKPLICSTGMATEQEIKETVGILQNNGARYALLHTNSTYPSPFKDLNIKYLSRLKELGDCVVGYSGHERGIHIPVAAVALGARIVEKHFTIDKNLEGNDHKVSLLPEEFQQMVKQIRETEEALGDSSSRVISQGEIMNRVNLAKSLISLVDIKEGETIKNEMIDVKSPGRGIQPNRRLDLVGRRANRNIAAGDFFYNSDLLDSSNQARSYSVKRKWGIPVRYHDFKPMLAVSNPDFLEFHLSYKDMDLNAADFFPRVYDLDLVVHSPDLFVGDHILNLAADDDSYRRRSVDELQRVIDLTLHLKQFFSKATKPRIVASLGGFTRESHVGLDEKNRMYDRIMESLGMLDAEGVEILAQTLPPFPWYLGGQLYLNLFVEADDTAEFCRKSGLRVCLDVCHSRMATNYYKASFRDFLRQVGPYTAHLHIADAEGVDGEGLQIGDGDMDFKALAEDLDLYAPEATFIPEIWMGHKNNGEGFWIAMERLEGLF